MTAAGGDPWKSPKGGDPWKSPKGGAVEIYCADRRALESSAATALVTEADRARLTPTTHARRRAEFLAGRALLRHALASHTGRPPASFRIEASAEGKPSCVGGPALSLSHSGDVFVCALADSAAVGVDVETRAPRSLGAVAERYFTPAEARWLAADAEPRFRMLWVLKEAYLKARGVGLAGGLSSLECRIEPPSIEARVRGDAAVPQLVLLRGAECFVGVALLGAPRLEHAVHPAAFGAGDAGVAALELVARTA